MRTEPFPYNRDSGPSLIQKITITIELSARSLRSSRKWLLYVFLALLPLIFSFLSRNKLFGNIDWIHAYVDFFVGTFVFFFFTFGCILFALPLSSDEIIDKTIDLYLIRPFPRSILWACKWMVHFFAIILTNLLIASLYYSYFLLVDQNISTDNKIAEFFGNLNILGASGLLLIFVTLTYSGLFLCIGFLGRKGFSIGIGFAVFELFFLGLVFLRESIYVPRTHVIRLATELFSGFELYTWLLTAPDLLFSQIYIIAFALFCFIAGTLLVTFLQYE
jgi:hypothetical protein